ncbi:unnamed protein product [Didymodactylos carnosus]|uniref:Uncharacterized protein n=1 Tax=Didymodactylos carnosus TaxID=1234261 RepID=A0A815HH64_9BILA|nr:unnamed protein product [Didymodactylos carnosus]CAF4226235.1 unnamed protein product [Didymodactylos carnosus]
MPIIINVSGSKSSRVLAIASNQLKVEEVNETPTIHRKQSHRIIRVSKLEDVNEAENKNDDVLPKQPSHHITRVSKRLSTKSDASLAPSAQLNDIVLQDPDDSHSGTGTPVIWKRNLVRKSKIQQQTKEKDRRCGGLPFPPCCCCAVAGLLAGALIAAVVATLLTLANPAETTTTTAITMNSTSITLTTSTSTTSTTATFTTSTTASTTSTTSTTATTATSTTTTSTTSTTTTAQPCSSVCINTTTSTAGSLMALYLFDSNANDYTNTYNGTEESSPTYVTGYVDSAINLVSSSQQSVTLPLSLALNNRSMTVGCWLKLQSPLYITSTATEVSIISQCPSMSYEQCLFYTIRSNVLYQAFYLDDKAGTTSMSGLLGQWIHVAFTFDLTTLLRQIYINGIAEPTGFTYGLNGMLQGGSFLGTGAPATIGRNMLLSAPTNYLNAYVDHFSISNRAKSACEVLNDATLVAYFSFDSGSLVDSGPNMLVGTAVGQTMISGERNQALSFTGGTNSYFQVSGLTAIGTVSSSFSIGLWINANVLYGTIVHVSRYASGAGGWCLPFLGFTSSQQLAAQIWDGLLVQSALGPILKKKISFRLKDGTIIVKAGIKSGFKYLKELLLSKPKKKKEKKQKYSKQSIQHHQQ